MESQRLLGFPGGSTVKKPPAMQDTACNSGDAVSIPGSERSTAEGNGYPLYYSGLENSVGRGGWWATVHGVYWTC